MIMTPDIILGPAELVVIIACMTINLGIYASGLYFTHLVRAESRYMKSVLLRNNILYEDEEGLSWSDDIKQGNDE